jgi:hypothetical protein
MLLLRVLSICLHQKFSGRTVKTRYAINYLIFKKKNMRNKIFMIICFLAAFLIVSSCLKDKIGEDWTSSLKGKMYAQFPSNGAQSFVIQPVATDQIFKFLVNIATDALPTTDITLTFAVDQAAMDAFNKEMHAADTSILWSYELYPALTILDPTITIAAGTRNAYVHVKLSNADTLRLTAKYMAPISITSASGGVVIASNMKTVLYSLPIANKWEGTYKMKGYILRNLPPIDEVLSGFYKGRTYKLGTSGPNSVTLNKGMAWADSEIDYAGGISFWQITITEPANTITVSDATNPAVQIFAPYPNRYDPATRTFYMKVFWGAGVDFRSTTDTLVYSGPY